MTPMRHACRWLLGTGNHCSPVPGEAWLERAARCSHWLSTCSDGATLLHKATCGWRGLSTCSDGATLLHKATWTAICISV